MGLEEAALIAQTPRLVVRRFTTDDAAFVLRQLNEPSWIANIGDRGVRSIEDAAQYIHAKLLAPYDQHGFGMYLVEAKDGGDPVGMCGLVKREVLPEPDIGFSLLEREWGKGYAEEAARAMVAHAFVDIGLERLLGIVKPANERSGRLLQKLGFETTGTISIDGQELRLYATRPPEPGQPNDLP